MAMENYKKINNLLGWVSFAIAAFVYIATLEPTVSFWDCGEYIATSAKLMVGHPPGAPLFQLIGNFFSLFAFGDLTQVAYMVNLSSALSSAFTILFLFWTITHLSRKIIIKKGGAIDQKNMRIIFGSGLVGALAYTFSDSFWFSAVEGEVYAMSSFFTSVAFWAILKWENAVDAEDERADRWIVLIAYLIGLAIGVHILVFLTIPAIGMIYYFKKFKYNRNGFYLANIISVAILGLVFQIIIPLTLKLFGFLEINLVNHLGLPFDSGSVAAIVILAALTWFGVRFARQKEKPIIATAVLGIAYIVIGYSSFVTLAIRSNANPPIDENNPEDALSLLAYYNREQYGDWPKFYGQSFNAEVESFVDGNPTYYRDEESGKYLISNDGKESVRKFKKEYIGFFPRMWSDDPNHVRNYIALMDIKDTKKKPSFGLHFKFFMDYQIGHMWWRYFMWNFAGRQNDQQHRYELTKGNWLSGIGFVDKMHIGPQDNLPDHFARNKARNTYFLLPLILGLIGLWFHFKANWKDGWAIMMFFLFTGIAIVVYTNHKPFEPRERDYAFVGSFYVFAIWIGLGVHALFDLLKESRQNASTALMISAACLIGVPGLMAQQNWDDHDRSGRTTARDIAKAYLDSCAPNAILFTNGDNDTFPLWYVQEVEQYRTDVRVVNLSLLNTDWYIDQMRRKAYDSDAVPFGFEWKQYKQGTRDVLYYRDIGIGDKRWRAEDFMKWVKSDDPKTRFKTMGTNELQFYPVKKLRVKVDKKAVIENQVVQAGDEDKIVDYIDWDFRSNALPKRDLMLMDLIAYNDWTRPIYFSITVGGSRKAYFYLDEYFQLEGLAYRFVPIKNPKAGQNAEFGRVQTDVMYDNMMNKFAWDNMNDPGLYLDETNRRLSYNFRNIFGRLGSALAMEGKKEKAIEVLDHGMEQVPAEVFGYNYFVLPVIEAYYRAGATEKAHAIVSDFADDLDEELAYFQQFKGKWRKSIQPDMQESMQYYQMLMQMVNQYEIGRSGDKLEENEFYQRYLNTMGPLNAQR